MSANLTAREGSSGGSVSGKHKISDLTTTRACVTTAPTDRTRVGALTSRHTGHDVTPVGPARTPTVHWGPYEGGPSEARTTSKHTRASASEAHTSHGSGAVGPLSTNTGESKGGDTRTDLNLVMILSFRSL